MSTEQREDTLFAKIVRGEIPADMVYQDDLVSAFRDISPAAPTHVLIVPNRIIPSADDISADDEQTLGRMLVVAQKIGRDEGIGDSGYRLIINCKEDGRQEVPHLHMHLLGGRNMGRMLQRPAD